MNPALIPSFNTRYQLTPEISREPAPQNVRSAVPSEAAREDLLLQKLGVTGWGRILHFRNFYSQGWGERGHGMPLSPRSLEAFFRYLEIMPKHERETPKVFLTDDGHLELLWRDSAGKSIQLEFTPQETEYYIEASQEENAVPHSEIQRLINLLPTA